MYVGTTCVLAGSVGIFSVYVFSVYAALVVFLKGEVILLGLHIITPL